MKPAQKRSNQPLEHACATLPFWPAKHTIKITKSGFTCEPRKTLPIPYPTNETLVGRDFIREEFYSPQNRGQIQRSRSKLKQPDVPFSTAQMHKIDDFEF